jgi:hypothetical protein
MAKIKLIPAAVLLMALAACKPADNTPPPVAAPSPAATATAAPEVTPPLPIELKDEIENNARYVIGISYPPGINAHPGLAKVIGDYAKTQRDYLMQTVEALGNKSPRAPYELSLSFEQVLDTPTLIAISADGSRYTGGAHAEPLVARFVWLPQQEKLLTADELISSADGWRAVSDYVREQLRTQLSVRADAQEMTPEVRAEFMRNANNMIDAGTAPKAASFSQFQPVFDAAGKVVALRFVFPPYQMGPYSDGTQSVDVPVDVLRPYLTPEYAELFGG